MAGMDPAPVRFLGKIQYSERLLQRRYLQALLEKGTRKSKLRKNGHHKMSKKCKLFRQAALMSVKRMLRSTPIGLIWTREHCDEKGGCGGLHVCSINRTAWSLHRRFHELSCLALPRTGLWWLSFKDQWTQKCHHCCSWKVPAFKTHGRWL